MRVHVLQHLAAEDIGGMSIWFEARGARLSYTRFHEPDPILPELAGLDLLVIMGGPMSVNDEAELPWLVAEKRFVRAAIEHGVAVLGICLGAQLIASAMGAAVYAGPHKEIGWFPVTGHGCRGEGVFDFPGAIELFHWHGETFDLPEGATLLASSAAYVNQMFQLGPRVIGLQCHPEMTPEVARALLAECADELAPGPWVQSAASMTAAQPTRYAPGHALMGRILDFLCPV